eukprot:TRINITY_DN351_c0_g1_i1.p1 TRINITY_DN351_c0_g1~~TRINITY_DN351_c0_g1_i1.p1  ORF type:complete len:215 (+),score=75.20 TRINITY_DN351_c0_g1_i1:56-700(+)
MEGMKAEIKEMLQGIERYNPDKVSTLEHYVNLQARERGYDLEANLALLKLYQFMPDMYKLDVVAQILLLSLTNLPHTDIVLCKAMLTQDILHDDKIKTILYLSELLEMCQFKTFWEEINKHQALTGCVVGFEDAIRKFVCHVISITYQTIEDKVLRELLGLVDENAIRKWTDLYGWNIDGSFVYLASQEEIIKTRNITEKVDLESVASIMASCY